MTTLDIIAFLPLFVLAAASILVLITISAMRRGRHPAVFTVCLLGLAAALATVGFSWPLAPRRLTALLTFDRFSLFTTGLIIASTILIAIISYPYFRGREDERGEYYFLLMLASLGGCILASSAHFASLFLGLELLSVSLFTLIAYARERIKGIEAGFMYLILAGVSSAFLFFGMALSYLSVGSLEIGRIAEAAGRSPGVLLSCGLGLMTVGIGFKLAVVPFHFWTPDIYDGAPAPVSGYVATVSKGAMAVFLVRFFAPGGIGGIGAFPWVFAVISGATMFVGNFLALREGNVKRMLACSSIAHLGYLLIAFLAGGTHAVTAMAFFLAAYFASTLGAFSCVTALSSHEGESDLIEHYAGLAARRPWVAGCFTAFLLSLAGLPLTAGFMGKFILFEAGEGALLWVLAVLLAVNSTLSLFYYLRIVSVMYRPKGELEGKQMDTATGPLSVAAGAPGNRRIGVSFLSAVAVALAALAVVVLGVYPTPLLKLIALLATG